MPEARVAERLEERRELLVTLEQAMPPNAVWVFRLMR